MKPNQNILGSRSDSNGMNILITTQIVDINDPILGFTHQWIVEFSKYFREVHVICLKEGTHSFPNNVHVYSLGKEGGENRIKYLTRFYKYFWHIFFKVRTDYVFFHMGAIFNVLASPFFLIRKGKGVVFYWWKAHGRINLFGRIAMIFCDEIITSTASGFPIRTSKRRIVGQAIDTNQFVLPETNTERTKEIIFVGRIMPIKHVEVFMEVAKELRDYGYFFSIIGPSDATYMKDLKTTLGFDSVEFLGPKTQAELVKIYQRAHMFLNTSLTHSMDKTVLEAMLCGCIPLTSNRAFAELLTPYDLFFEAQDSKDYITAIRKTEDKDLTVLRSKLRMEVETKHSLDTFTKRIFKIL